MDRRIALIPGDGIGPEVLDAAVEVAEAALSRAGQAFIWVRFPWGSDFYLRHGRMMPGDALDELRGFDAILLGAVGDPRLPDHVTLHGLLLPIRRSFDQHLCVRPVRLYDGVTPPLRDVSAGEIDLVIYRENTEGEYSDVGGSVYPDTPAEVAIQSNVFTRRGCERIIEAGFEAARGRRRLVTSVTKSNAQTHGMVLWDRVFGGVAERYPDVTTRSLLVDAAAVELVRKPAGFDVVVASNLFGDILSDLAAAIVGGLGLAPSGNINPSGEAPSMFEPVHGSAPDIAGRGIANPIAAILSAAMMLAHLGFGAAAQAMESAVAATLRNRTPRTPDLGGTGTTAEMTGAIVRAIAP